MENTNPLLQKIKLPGRTFQLPSRGALYQNGEVANAEGEIHVHALSALAEINLKNPDLLFNGKAIQEVFSECIPEIKNASALYARDIDALMFFLRLVTYGPHFEISVKHNCEKAKDHAYVVNIEELTQQMKFLDPTIIDDLFTITLPNAQVVKITPVKFEHLITLFQMNANKTEISTEDQKKNIVFNLLSVIHSVDGVTDKGHIEEWIKLLTTPFQNRIAEAVEKTSDWGPAKSAKIKCKDCGEIMEVELPLSPISFFTE